MNRPLPKPIAMLLIALVLVRVASVTWSAAGRTGGDFFASMPGAYVQHVNPALWNSPDLVDAWGYHNDTYFHGPVQYLTLYPVAFLDSYRQIAMLLLPIYLLVLSAAFWLMWRLARALGASRDAFVAMLASTFLFFPLLQAYLQREFEVVITLALAGAVLLIVTNRRSRGAALLAYVAWFKYIPLLFAGYLLLRRWWKPVVAFAAASAVILFAAQLLFGLPRFFNNNVPGHAAQVFALGSYDFKYDATGHLYGTGFCNGWYDNITTLTNIRSGLCTMASAHRWTNPSLLYLLICTAVAAIYLLTHFQLERRSLSPQSEMRRRAIEFSIVTTVCACFIFSHYYYLIALIIPFNVLLAIVLSDGRYGAFGWWCVSYVLVSALVVPMTLLSRIAGFDVWEPYVFHACYWYGEVLLVLLLLHEYRRLASLAAVSA